MKKKYVLMKKIFWDENCSDLNEKNADVINAITLQKTNEEKYQTIDFIYSAITQFYNEIKELEQMAERNSNQLLIQKEIQTEIDILSSPLNAELNQLTIEQNIEICESYGFEEGSQLYGECILALIKEKIIDE